LRSRRRNLALRNFCFSHAETSSCNGWTVAVVG
jgi:hypothetical protein